MTVLAWLLLYATVTQLGLSNNSISSEDGTYEVNNYANNTFSSIDRSQIRRARRSADSDVAELTKKRDDERAKRDRLDNETAAANEKYEAAKKAHKEAVDAVATEKDLLRAKEGLVTKLKNDISDATTACVQPQADYDKAEQNKKTADTAWTEAKKELNIVDLKINNTVDGLKAKAKAAEKVWEAARDKHKDKNEKLTKWLGAKKNLSEATAKKAEYDGAITAFGELDLVKTEKAKYDAKVAELTNKRDTAKTAMEKAQTVKDGIDNNKILKKELSDGDPKTFTKPLKDAIIMWEARAPEEKNRAEIIASLKEIVNLVGLDSQQSVDKLIADFANLKTKAKDGFDAATTEFTKKKSEFEENDKNINDATIKLGPNLELYNEAEKKKTEADKKLKEVENKISESKKEMTKNAIALGGVDPLDEVKWTKEVTKLEKDMNTKKGTLDTANGDVATEEVTYTTLKKTADDAKTKVDDAKTKMDNAETANKAAIAKRNDLQGQLPKLEKEVEEKQREIDAITAKLPGLKKAEEEAKKAHDSKKEEHYNSMQAVSRLDRELEIAVKEKAAAEAEAIKKDQEHQAQVRALSLGFGVTAGIVVIGAAVGLSVFLVMRRRRKQKKEAAAKVPKREEIDAPNGLTIIRREGMQDKYVVKGEDFNFRGPLVRGRVHNEVPTKHMLDDQVGGDKIETIFFDKKLNDAYLIGEGVEIIEEDSVSVSEGKKTNMDPVELLANMSAEDMAGSSQKYIKDTDAKGPPAGDKKSSKSKRASSSTPKKTGAAPDDKKA